MLAVSNVNKKKVKRKIMLAVSNLNKKKIKRKTTEN